MQSGVSAQANTFYQCLLIRTHTVTDSSYTRTYTLCKYIHTYVCMYIAPNVRHDSMPTVAVESGFLIANIGQRPRNATVSRITSNTITYFISDPKPYVCMYIIDYTVCMCIIVVFYCYYHTRLYCTTKGPTPSTLIPTQIHDVSPGPNVKYTRSSRHQGLQRWLQAVLAEGQERPVPVVVIKSTKLPYTRLDPVPSGTVHSKAHVVLGRVPQCFEGLKGQSGRRRVKGEGWRVKGGQRRVEGGW